MNAIGIISMQYARPFTAEHFHLFPSIKSSGFDFIELLVPEPGELDLNATRNCLEQAGLGVVLAARVNLQRNIASGNPKEHQAGIDYLKFAIESAATLGARIVGGPLTGNPLVFAGRAPQPVDEKERLARKARCVDALGQVAICAQKHGITLAVEPLNRFESDVLCTVQQGIELLDAINNTSLTLLLDTFHMAMEESSIADSIRLAGRRIGHFQANENHRGFPGTGSVDWIDVCRALHDIGYKGPISLEPFRRNDDRFGVPIAQWRPPHEDEHERITASIEFIRAQLHLTRYRR